MRRAAAIVAALLAALTLIACGDSGSGDAVEDALSFMPKDSAIAATFATDPDGGQWKRLDEILAKFPFSGRIEQELEQRISQGTSLDFQKDIKPILGNDGVFAIPSTAALERSDSAVLIALKVDDEGAAEDFVKKDANKIATFEGTDLYKERGDTYVAVKDGVIVVADTRDDLEAAITRHDGDEGMTKDDLDARFAGLEGDGLLKIGVNAQQLLAESKDPEAVRARKVKWVGALRDVGFLVAARDDGIEVSFKTTSAGGLTPEDLPLASGAEAAPVVRSATEVAFGLRDPAQIVNFVESAEAVADPKEHGDYEQEKARFGKRLGVDVDRDILSQFEGDSSVSVGIDGSVALRADLRDPAAFRDTLRTAVPRLERTSPGTYKAVVVPKRADGFYIVTTTNDKSYAFRVAGGRFVLATDPARLAQFAAQSPSDVPGAKGAFTMAFDARAVANAVAQRQGQGGAGLFTGALGDFTGSVQSETSGMSGSFKLNVK
jgi:Protein of unknown function (DUF3352)